MKIFIWENVLTDWTDGLAVAYAETLEEALGTFERNIDDSFGKIVAKELGKPTKIIDCEKDKTPFGVYVYGGG